MNTEFAMTDVGLGPAAVKLAGSARTPALRWSWRWWRPDTSLPVLQRLADELAGAVARREVVLLEQLCGGDDKAVQLGFDDVSVFTADDHRQTYPLSNVGTFARQQAPQQRLVVLGETGSGKTVLAIRLLLDQLAYRGELDGPRRATSPVAVRVSVAGWDGSSDFSQWLTNRIAQSYRQNKQQIRALIDHGMILPVLDGLDEMDPPGDGPHRASTTLDALNQTPWRNRPVVLTCRTEVYTRIRQQRDDAGLHGAARITLQPLSPTDITTYLRTQRDHLEIPAQAWAPVTDQIAQRPDGPLATALRTPWLLGLAAEALRRDPQAAAALARCPDASAVTEQLFAALIPAAIQATDPPCRYTQAQVHTWLHTLAQYLQQRSDQGIGAEVTLADIWPIAGNRRCRTMVGLVFGLVVGLAGGLAFGLAFELVDGLVVGLALGLAVGLLVGLATMSEDRSADRLALGQPAHRIIRDELVFWLVFWPVVKLVVKLAGWLAGWLSGGLAGWLVTGLAIGLVYGLLNSVAAGRYATACLIFRATGTFAPQPAQFLEWARNTGLLRVTDIAYQFRHITYQQWLLAEDNRHP